MTDESSRTRRPTPADLVAAAEAAAGWLDEQRARDIALVEAKRVPFDRDAYDAAVDGLRQTSFSPLVFATDLFDLARTCKLGLAPVPLTCEELAAGFEAGRFGEGGPEALAERVELLLPELERVDAASKDRIESGLLGWIVSSAAVAERSLSAEVRTRLARLLGDWLLHENDDSDEPVSWEEVMNPFCAEAAHARVLLERWGLLHQPH